MADAAEGPKDATPITRAQNEAVLGALPFEDMQDFEDARRGFLGTLPEVEITNAQGRVVWSLRDYAFLAAGEAPPTVNPSLWRQARLNMASGLFRVTERIYQIRGFDLSNMTLIEGDRGVIVIDPLISTEVWVFSDTGRRYALTLDNCALTYLADRARDDADATVTTERGVLDRLVLRELAFADAVEQGLVAIDGSAAKVAELFSLLDDFELMFPVMEPRRAR